MTITNLNSDLYFADNPIIVRIENINPNVKYIEVAPSLIYSASIFDANLKLYLNNFNNFEYDISPIVKALFKTYPHNTDYTNLDPFVIPNNWINIKFYFNEVLKDGTSTSQILNKTFIKGGKRVQDINQSWPINKPLIVTDDIPQWRAYPVSYNYFNSERQMVKANLIPDNLRELRKVKGCDPVYIKFRNSVGGYSYWLFEGLEVEDSHKSLGYTSTQSSFYDLGNEVKETLSVNSKVPKKYYALMQDLASSSEIYLYKNNSGLIYLLESWERIKGINNKVSFNPYKANEKVKLKFELIRKYNPSELWSN